MTPLRGWAARGARLIGKAPFGNWTAMTFIAALGHDAVTAHCGIDWPVTGEIFRTYVEQVLAPTLHPYDIVIMDNLGSHRAPAIRRAIRAAGARPIVLSAHSPDLNPIEQVLQSSNTSSERPPNAQRKPSGAESEPSSTSSLPKNAKTTSETPGMVPSTIMML